MSIIDCTTREKPDHLTRVVYKATRDDTARVDRHEKMGLMLTFNFFFSFKLRANEKATVETTVQLLSQVE